MFLSLNARPLILLALRILFVLFWIILSITALVSLRKRKLSETARALWAMLVVAMPILGALAYWIVRPEKGEAVE
jgi:succinate dehydrogenase/fumarate reductase cytochrome b subunit